jgi:hypothetical protein
LQINNNVSQELAATLHSVNTKQHGPLNVLPYLAMSWHQDPVTAIKAYGGVALQHYSFLSSATEDE